MSPASVYQHLTCYSAALQVASATKPDRPAAQVISLDSSEPAGSASDAAGNRPAGPAAGVSSHLTASDKDQAASSGQVGSCEESRFVSQLVSAD